jgi:hypothetical protein
MELLQPFTVSDKKKKRKKKHQCNFEKKMKSSHIILVENRLQQQEQ